MALTIAEAAIGLSNTASNYLGNSVGHKITVTPVVGDVILVFTSNNRVPPRGVTGVSGCGATWTKVFTGSRNTAWLGTSASGGALTTGAIDVAFDATTFSAQSTCFLLRGLTAPFRVVGVEATNTSTDLGGPVVSADLNQFVFTECTYVNDAGITTQTPVNPSIGWTNGQPSGILTSQGDCRLSWMVAGAGPANYSQNYNRAISGPNVGVALAVMASVGLDAREYANINTGVGTVDTRLRPHYADLLVALEQPSRITITKKSAAWGVSLTAGGTYTVLVNGNARTYADINVT